MEGACLKDAEQLRDPVKRWKLLRVAEGYINLAEHVGNRQNHATAQRTGDDPKPNEADS